MSSHFVDTSALAKRYVIENGTRWVGASLDTTISADNDLLVAAAAEGFTIDNPNLHP